jgi:hypothetical protein
LLLIGLPQDQAKGYCEELERLDGGCKAWVIGRVVSDPHRKAHIVDNVDYLEVY